MVEVDPFNIGETAGKLVTGAQSERHAEKAALREAAAGTPEMQRAAQAHANRLAVKEEFLLKLWKPVAKMVGISQEYFSDEFPKELAAKLESIPEEDLRSPKPSIAAPAMQALGYSLDEPALKEMYLNLLAGASVKTKAAQVHPSFVDAIRGLSSEEAEYLDLVLRTGILPLARVRRFRPSSKTYDVLVPYLLNFHTLQPLAPIVVDGLAGWINNWERLGLVHTTFQVQRRSLAGESDPYEWVDTRPEFIKLKATEPIAPEGTEPEWVIDIEKGSLRPTDRGAAFYRVVSSPT